jgi:hypothetical protein
MAIPHTKLHFTRVADQIRQNLIGLQNYMLRKFGLALVLLLEDFDVFKNQCYYNLSISDY